MTETNLIVCGRLGRLRVFEGVRGEEEREDRGEPLRIGRSQESYQLYSELELLHSHSSVDQYLTLGMEWKPARTSLAFRRTTDSPSSESAYLRPLEFRAVINTIHMQPRTYDQRLGYLSVHQKSAPL